MKVCVIGLGYIGFPTACIIARAGHAVLGVDVNEEIIQNLNRGALHIVNENQLEEVAREAFASGRLRVSTLPEPADVFIIAVPTPHQRLAQVEAVARREVAAGTDCPTLSAVASGEEPVQKYGADLSYVDEATRGIVPYLRPGSLVVLESTVSPRTTIDLVRRILEEGTGMKCGEEFLLAHAPERVLPGRIVEELIENDRIVGGVDTVSTERAIDFYRTFVRGSVVGTDATTAELVKLMENTFRDVNIALANEFALICERLRVNVFEAINLANRHPRVNILKPGPGVGGHCIAVDPYFIVEAAPEDARLISVARIVNSTMPDHVVDLVRQIERHTKQPLRNLVALGASYKPDVGDERESPALEVEWSLTEHGYNVAIHDPYISRYSSHTVMDLAQSADLLILLTDHKVYRDLSPEELKPAMAQLRILDTRGFFDHRWDDAGFDVYRLGVGPMFTGSRDRRS